MVKEVLSDKFDWLVLYVDVFGLDDRNNILVGIYDNKKKGNEVRVL